MSHIFITKPRQSYGYAYVCFFDLKHFSYHIEPAKPKRPGYSIWHTISFRYRDSQPTGMVMIIEMAQKHLKNLCEHEQEYYIWPAGTYFKLNALYK